MEQKNILKNIIDTLQKRGADKVKVTLSESNTEELNTVYKELNLFRSISSQRLSIMIIKEQKMASTSLNQIDDLSIENAMKELMLSVEAANPDPAYDISPYQDAVLFEKGELKPDLDKACERLMEFNDYVKKEFPSVQFDATLTHSKVNSFYMNSNGVDFQEIQGYYSFNTMFTAKNGNKMSSFNYTGFSLKDMEKELMKINFTDILLKQITEQTQPKSIPENFTGDVLLAPFVTLELLEQLLNTQISDSGLLMKVSKFSNHLNQKILDEKLTVHSRPLDADICVGSPITSDGFTARNDIVIDKGVLKHYLISQYVSNKTGKERTIGPDLYCVLETGDKSYKNLIKGIKKGILCMRISAGNPNAHGDFSGVVKNSYYIEDGEILFPIKETMISANLIDMFNNISAVSSESFNTGYSKAPFMQIKEIFFSK